MVDSVDDLKSSRSIEGFCHFPNFEMLNAKHCACSEQDHPECLSSRKGQSEGAEYSERGSVPSRKTDRLHDLRLLHDTVLDYADLFVITLHNDDVQEFDTRWADFLLSRTKIPPDDILDSCTN